VIFITYTLMTFWARASLELSMEVSVTDRYRLMQWKSVIYCIVIYIFFSFFSTVLQLVRLRSLNHFLKLFNAYT